MKLVAAMMAVASLQDAAPPLVPERQDVVVEARRDPFRLDADVLRAGQAAFERNRDAFAPAAALAFVLETRRGGQLSASPSMLLTDGTRVLPVPVEPDGRLRLPPIPLGRWRLQADRGRRSLRVRPLVLSAGADRLDYRLGDARLQCRVMWAMAKADAPLLAAPAVGLLDTVGLCSSRRFGIYTGAPGPILAAVVSADGRDIALPVSAGGRSYRLPLSDKALNNDARVRVALQQIGS